MFDTLLGLGEKVTWVRGNGDREMLTAARSAARPAIPIDRWAVDRLTPDHLNLLEHMPQTARLSITGLGEVLFCHATPRDDEEVVLVDSRPDRWEEVLSTLPADVGTVVRGHTHMPFVRLTLDPGRQPRQRGNAVRSRRGALGAAGARRGPAAHRFRLRRCVPPHRRVGSPGRSRMGRRVCARRQWLPHRASDVRSPRRPRIGVTALTPAVPKR